MNKKLTSFSLLGLYLLPWGIQYLIYNFMSVYVASYEFASEKTVGEILAIGAIVTCLSQAAWSYIAGKCKNKANVLCLTFVLLAAFSMLFLNERMTKPLLYLSVILFYSCFTTHQPLIDTICSEIHHHTGFTFGFFRSFASLGYALMGFVLVVLPHEKPTSFFLYCAVLAIVSAVFSKMIRAPRVQNDPEDKNKNIFNAAYIKFLVYTFILFSGCNGITAFFAVYFTSPEGLGGSLGMFSLILGIGAFAEWLVVMFYSKISHKIKPKYTFFIVAFTGVFRSLFIYIAKEPAVAALSMIFSCIWYGLLWASATPYIKNIVPAEGNVFAQGIWTVVACGVAAFAGSYVSGIYAEAFGQRSLFLAVSILMGALALLTPVFIDSDKSAKGK